LYPQDKSSTEVHLEIREGLSELGNPSLATAAPATPAGGCGWGLRLFISLWVLACAAAIAVSVGPNLLASAFVASLVIFCAGSVSRREALLMLCLGCAFTLLNWGAPLPVGRKLMMFASFLGMGAIVVRTLAPFYVRGLRPWSRTLAEMLAAPAYIYVCSLFLTDTQHRLAFTYDSFLYRFDGSLGFQPSFWAGSILLRNPWIAELADLAYINIAGFVALAYVVQRRRNAKSAHVFAAFCGVLGCVGAVLYYAFPAVGALYLFPGRFPFDPVPISAMPLSPIAVAAAFPRNCMPSLHTSWTLAACWGFRRVKMSWRVAMGAIASFLLLETLSYHYLIDMVVAVPFTVAVFAGTHRHLRRDFSPVRALGLSALICGVWLISLRFAPSVFLVNRIVPWGAMMATVVVSLYLWRTISSPGVVTE
jgi:hypothetical protein